MNIHAPVPTTERRQVLLTYADVRRMVEEGRLDPDKKYELLDGVLYEMPAEGTQHILHKSEIVRYLNRTLDEMRWMIIPDSTLLLSDLNAPEPDIYVYPASIRLDDLSGRDVSLIIEVALSSIITDSQVKAGLYAAHGVQEYWIVDVENARTKVLRRPQPDGDWGHTFNVGFDEELVSEAVDGFSLTIADLPHLKG